MYVWQNEVFFYKSLKWSVYSTDKLPPCCSKDFEHYAFTCFKFFGDRVKNWITFNEPHGYTIQGYDLGIQAPGRCSILGHLFCKEGKSSTEPYIVAHNILLSHAAVYHSYHHSFKVCHFKQESVIYLVRK